LTTQLNTYGQVGLHVTNTVGPTPHISRIDDSNIANWGA